MVEVIDCAGDDYLYVMEDDEDVEWRKLTPWHHLIIRFHKERTRLLASENNTPLEIPHNQQGIHVQCI